MQVNVKSRLKKLGTALLYPHFAVMLLLLPVAAACLVYALLKLQSDSPLAVAAYVVSFYTLTVWCLKLPKLVGAVKRFKQNNTIAARWLGDTSLRVRTTLLGAVAWNSAYAVMQLVLGIANRSFWFTAFAVYYFLLAVMRGALHRYLVRNTAGENLAAELKSCRGCGVALLFMNVALSVIVFYMVYRDRTFYHGEIVTIAMAAYTFLSFALAVKNTVKYRKFNSPIYSASKSISLAAACVSVLTLEATMLTTFESGEMTPETRQLFLILTGAAVSAFVIVMALGIIIGTTKELKR